MHHFTFPSGDTTLYKLQNTQNSGIDEILEVEKAVYSGTLRENARALLKFDITPISNSIVSGTISTNASFFLNLTIAEAKQIPLEYTIYAYPLSQSFQLGVGTKYDGVTSTGASWLYKDSAANATLWVSGSTLSTGSLSANTTGSVDGSGGGTWYTSSAASQSFSYESANIRMDVSSIVREWLSGSIPNEGFIIKHSEAVETDSQDYGTLQFFSMDTSTVYPPSIEVAWDDSTISTGSLSESSDSTRVVYFKDLRPSYKNSSKARIRLFSRARYPSKTFTTGSQYNVNNYLPSSSYYSIQDASTEDVIIPFSDYTKLSIDSNGSYFDQWMSGLQPERFYRILVKVERNGLVDFYDHDNIFKVVR
jgi:hypothetical protein